MNKIHLSAIVAVLATCFFTAGVVKAQEVDGAVERTVCGDLDAGKLANDYFSPNLVTLCLNQKKNPGKELTSEELKELEDPESVLCEHMETPGTVPNGYYEPWLLSQYCGKAMGIYVHNVGKVVSIGAVIGNGNSIRVIIDGCHSNTNFAACLHKSNETRNSN